MITLINISGFGFTKKIGICIAIIKIRFGIANWQISSFLTELSIRDAFSFPDDNFGKYQQIFTKLAMCIDIVEILFGIANGKLSSILDSYLSVTHPYFSFRTINSNRVSPNLICALILWRSGLGLFIGNFHRFLTELYAHDMIMAGYYRFTFSFYLNLVPYKYPIYIRNDKH